MLRDLLARVGHHGFAVSDVAVERTSQHDGNGGRAVTVRLEVRGTGSLSRLSSDLDDIDGVTATRGARLDDA